MKVIFAITARWLISDDFGAWRHRILMRGGMTFGYPCFVLFQWGGGNLKSVYTLSWEPEEKNKTKSWRSTVIWFRCITEEGGTYLLISFLTGETRTENRSWSPTGISSIFTPYFCPGVDPPDPHTRCFCSLISLSGLASIQRLGRIVMRKDGIPGCARGGWGEINKQPNKQTNK